MTKYVKDENGNIYYIEGKLGAGGQGCVFTVRDNNNVVIKALVNDEDDLEIIQDEEKYKVYQYNVRNIIGVGEFNNIAIPYVMLEKPYCGYVMLFMNGLQSIDKLMIPTLYKNKTTGNIYIDNVVNTDKVKALTNEEVAFAYNFNGGIVKRLKCMAKLAKILAEFEKQDVVYCDISPNNVYVSKDPKSYEAWLIDLDNLTHSDDVKSAIGTPKFMAPEVVNRNPNTIYSDRYSFALVAYQFLLVKDPFLGQAEDNYDSWDDTFDDAIAKGDIAWIWEKDDDSNRKPGSLNPHDFLNEEIFELFERTFNADGRKNPTHRPSMWEWYDALVKASESSFKGQLKYSEEAFSNLMKEQDKQKYCYQDINFISKQEPWQKQIDIKRYIVSLKRVIELGDEEGNKEYIAENDKKIYWDSNKDIAKYCLSNYDISNIIPSKYIDNFVIFSRQEQLFSRSNKFNVTCYDKDYEIICIEDNCIVKEIENLLKTTIIIKYKGNIIKKITIEKE